MNYKIIVDKQPMTNPSQDKEQYIINIEELRSLGDVYDSLVITNSEDYVIRRLSLSEYGILSVLPNPIKEPIQDINIKLFDGDNYIYISDMTGNNILGKYIIKNDFSDTFVTINEMNSSITQTAQEIELRVTQTLTGYATKTEMNSAITQTAEEINLEVSKKVGEDEVISKINQSAEQISIDAGKININGVVSANGTFEIDTAGNVTMSGNINLSNGKKVIGGDGLMTNLQFNSSGLVGHYVYPAFSSRFGLIFNVSIPNNFTIEKATITLFHSGVDFIASNGTTYHGNAQNVKCYKTSSIPTQKMGVGTAEFYNPSAPQYEPSNRITAFGEKSFSGSSSYGPIDITSGIGRGFQCIIIADYVNNPSDDISGYQKTGYISGVIDVIGYMKYQS